MAEYTISFVDPNDPQAAEDERFMREMELAQALVPFGSEKQKILDQLMLAKKLRGTELTGGRNPTGRVFTADRPLEALGSMSQKLLGLNNVESGFGELGGMNERMSDTIGSIVGRNRPISMPTPSLDLIDTGPGLDFNGAP